MTTEGECKHKKYLLLTQIDHANSWGIEKEFDSIWEFEVWLKEAQIYADYLLVENVDWHVTAKT